MQLFKYRVSLKLKGPVLSKATGLAAYGKDAMMACDTQGRYYLPKDLVKGRLRQSCEELRGVAGDKFKFSVEKWLGDPSGNKKDNLEQGVEPHTGRIGFSDFVFRENSEAEKGKTLPRISVDQGRGSVKTGALQIIEAPFAVGADVYFDGTIQFMSEKNEADCIIKEVMTGLRWSTSFGACRTVGFGRLICVDIKKLNVPASSIELMTLIQNKMLGLAIKPDAPFCFAGRQVNENIFESEVAIPGSAIKGGIATVWGWLLGNDKKFIVREGVDKSRNELCKYFDKIRFTHAFPSVKDSFQRPVVQPLSLVKAGDKCYDAALCENPVLINEVAPFFAVDWKDRSDMENKFGWPRVRRDLRVRTAMDSGLRRHKDEALFAYKTVVPDDYEWLGYIDFSDVPDTGRNEVVKQLQGLLAQGFVGWSKTKIFATAEVNHASQIKPAIVSKSDNPSGLWLVTLQTPAIICNPSEIKKTSGNAELIEAYKSAWADISNNRLALKWYFASQSLAGGYYLHRNFQEGKPYNPYLLTDAGSVFVFSAGEDVTAEEAAKLIEEWLEKGLTFPRWAKEAYARGGKEGDHWSNCPYIRQNGYGEIAVNLEHGFEMLKQSEADDGRQK